MGLVVSAGGCHWNILCPWTIGGNQHADRPRPASVPDRRDSQREWESTGIWAGSVADCRPPDDPPHTPREEDRASGSLAHAKGYRSGRDPAGRGSGHIDTVVECRRWQRVALADRVL